MEESICARLVKQEDLNHHGTLFAGRTAEWFIESAFISAAKLVGDPQNVVCLNVHGLIFKHPVKRGDIITFHSKVAKLGTTSITVYTKVHSELTGITEVDGYITFICVDEDGNKKPHGKVLDEPKDEIEVQIREKAKLL